MTLEKNDTILNGLVLAGGKSLGMKKDKGLINWHGREQRYHLTGLLQPLCREVFISCRSEQEKEIPWIYRIIHDKYEDLGPYGAILSAFHHNPKAAWLVIACDLPLVDAGTLQYLVTHRDPSMIATTFQSPHDGLPEPLVTIWEPKAFPALLQHLDGNHCCPRKVLLNQQISILQAPDPAALTNASTPEDAQKIRQILISKAVPSEGGEVSPVCSG